MWILKIFKLLDCIVFENNRVYFDCAYKEKKLKKDLREKEKNENRCSLWGK